MIGGFVWRGHSSLPKEVGDGDLLELEIPVFLIKIFVALQYLPARPQIGGFWRF
jgi:hypothetical protein